MFLSPSFLSQQRPTASEIVSARDAELFLTTIQNPTAFDLFSLFFNRILLIITTNCENRSKTKIWFGARKNSASVANTLSFAVGRSCKEGWAANRTISKNIMIISESSCQDLWLWRLHWDQCSRKKKKIEHLKHLQSTSIAAAVPRIWGSPPDCILVPQTPVGVASHQASQFAFRTSSYRTFLQKILE